jgi:hypothetical protein
MNVPFTYVKLCPHIVDGRVDTALEKKMTIGRVFKTLSYVCIIST